MNFERNITSKNYLIYLYKIFDVNYLKKLIKRFDEMKKESKKFFSILILIFISFGTLSIDLLQINHNSNLYQPNFSLKYSSSLDYLALIIDQDLVNSHTVGDQHSPSICALSNETIVGVWTDNNSKVEANIYGSVYDITSGSNIPSDFRINQNPIGFNAYPSICALSNDLFAVAWCSEFGEHVIVFNATSGTNNTAEYLIKEHLYWDSTSPSICAISDDSFAVTWISRDLLGSDNTIVYIMLFDANTGNNITSELKVNENIDGKKYNPLITSLDNDHFVVVWENGAANGFQAKVFNSSTGENTSSELLLNIFHNNEIQTPSISAFSNETFLLAWSSYSEDDSLWNIHASVINATNGKNTTKEFSIIKDMWYSRLNPSICALSNEIGVITWNTAHKYYSEIYTSVINITKGEFIVEEFQVSHNYTRHRDPSICSLSSNSFAIAWSVYYQDGDDFGICGSLFGPYDDIPSVEIVVPSTIYYKDCWMLPIEAIIYDRSVPGIVSAKAMIESYSNYEPINLTMHESLTYGCWWCYWGNISSYMNTSYHKITIWAIDNVGNIKQSESAYIYIIEKPDQSFPLIFLTIILISVMILVIMILATYIHKSKKKKKKKNILSSDKQSIKQDIVKISSKRPKCFNCDTLISKESAEFCKYCGIRVKCLQCGTLYLSEEEFCNYCGSSTKQLEEGFQSESIDLAKKDEKKRKTSLGLKKKISEKKIIKDLPNQDKPYERLSKTKNIHSKTEMHLSEIDGTKDQELGKKTIDNKKENRVDPFNNDKLLEIMKDENALENLNNLNITLLEKALWEKIKMLALEDDDLKQLLEDILALTSNERKYIVNGMLKLKETNDSNFKLDMGD